MFVIFMQYNLMVFRYPHLLAPPFTAPDQFNVLNYSCVCVCVYDGLFSFISVFKCHSVWI